MRLTWKDGVATALVAAVAGMYWAYLADVGLPLVSGPRALAGVGLVLGLAACAVGGANGMADPRPAERAIALIAAVTGFAGLIALATGSAVSLAILIGGTVLLWLVTTIRHALVRPSNPAGHEEQRMIARSHR